MYNNKISFFIIMRKFNPIKIDLGDRKIDLGIENY